MATITPRGGYHILNWTDPQTQKRRQQSLGKVGAIPDRDLKDILRIKEYELSTGARLLNANRRPAPRFEHFSRDYLMWHQTEYPNSHYRVAQIVNDHLIPEFGLKPLNLITVAEAEAFKTKRRFVAKASTVGKELRTLNAVINRAVDLKIISDNPISIVQAPKVLDSKPHRWYSSEELDQLYAVSGRRASWWRLFANTGMRRTEGLMLRRIWVRDSIRILSADDERTKSGKFRMIPITDGGRIALDALAGEGTHVLPQITRHSLSRHCAQDLERAGLDGSLHCLRHTYICHLLLAGVPIRTVQLYAGHSHITTTEIYAYQVLRADPEAAVRLSI